MSQPTFKGPTKYAVYGGQPGGVAVARISGANTLADAKLIIENHQKSYPGTEYSIWEATWKRVQP